MPTIVTMPDGLYRTTVARFNLVHFNTVAGPGAFNPQSSVSGPSAVFWQADMSFAPQTLADFLLYRRFVMKLRGGRVLARIYDPTMVAGIMGDQPLGAGGTTTTINVATSAAAGVESVTLKNLVASQAVALAAGDMLGIGENLHVVEDDCASDGAGEATVSIQPPLRLGVAVDDAVTTVKPTGLFRLIAGGQDLALDLDRLGAAFTLTFQEVPDVVA